MGNAILRIKNEDGEFAEVPALVGPKGDRGEQGIQGVQGPPGNQGSPGPGVPAGGTAGQILTKTSATDHNTAWKDAAEAGLTPYRAVYNGDFDDVVTPGVYMMSGALSNKPPSDESYYGLIVTKSDDGPYIQQIAIAESLDRVFLRRCEDTGSVIAWTDWVELATTEYVDHKTLAFSNVSIPTSPWAPDTTYSAQGYNWRAWAPCPGVTADYHPDVTFALADALSGNFAPVAAATADGVYIYAKTQPAATVTIPAIICERVV